jgi:hypothetical protein
MTNHTTPSPHPSTPPRPPSRLGRWGAWLRRFSARPWFLPAAGTITAADFFLPILPTQTLLVATTLLHPRRWLATSLWFVFGGVLGGALLAAAVGAWGPPVAERLFGAAMQGAGWIRVRDLVQDHGPLALAFLAMIPWPMRTGVAVCALLGVPWWQIVAALAAGRVVAFPGLACVISRSPAWLMRRPFFSRLRDEVRSLETPPAPGPRPGLVLCLLLASGALALTPSPAPAAERAGQVRLDDGRLMKVVETAAKGTVTREFFLPDGTLAVRESTSSATAPVGGVSRIDYLDTRSGLRFTVAEETAGRRLRLELAGKVEERVEPSTEPLVTAASLPALVAASRAELEAGRPVFARFPVVKAGKTLRVSARWKSLGDGRAEVVLRPTNPLFGVLADSLVVTLDAEGRVLAQRGLNEVLGGSAAKPGLQSGTLTFNP